MVAPMQNSRSISSLEAVLVKRKRMVLCIGAVSLLVILTGCATGSGSGGASPEQQYEEDRLRGNNWTGLSGETVADVDELADAADSADAAYEQGNYTSALRHYRELAQIGDKFSQYRIAVIYERGLGVDPDLVEALAWAALADEFRQDELVEYRRSLESRLGPQQLETAKERARQLSSRYSELALLRDRLDEQKKKLKNCTGSRLGSTCHYFKSAYGSVQDNIKALTQQIDLYLEHYGGKVSVRDVEPLDEEEEKPIGDSH